MIKVKIELCREGVEVPKYARKGDAGVDVTNAGEDICLATGETTILPTGVKLAIPLGYEVQVRPRSGLSFRTGLRICNAPGTIDCGFKDEIGIIVQNTGNEQIVIANGTRIAQLVLNQVPKMEFEKVESVENTGYNRCGGFGSTGQ